MVQRKQGLIVNITSMGGLQYALWVEHVIINDYKFFVILNAFQRKISNAAYGIGKAATDRMTQDCGVELKKYNVASVGLLLGGVKTESSAQMLAERGDKAVLKMDPTHPLLKVSRIWPNNKCFIEFFNIFSKT